MSTDPIANFHHQIINNDESFNDVPLEIKSLTMNTDLQFKWEKVKLNRNQRPEETMNHRSFVHGSNVYSMGG